MVKVLIIGGGVTGCCAADLFSKKGWDVTLFDTAPYLGGGVKTFTYGGHPYTFGPRHFLTRDEKLFEYLNSFITMRRIPEHEFLTYVEKDSTFYHYPIHEDDIPLMPEADQIRQERANPGNIDDAKNLEDYWIASVGPTLYDKFVNSYSKKMWQVESNKEIDDFKWSPKGVTIASGPKAAWGAAISAFPMPMNGYDNYCTQATAKATVHLNAEIDAFDMENRRIKVGGEWRQYDVVVSSVSPEIILNGAFGPLRWVGRDFLKIVFPMENVFPPNVYFLYYASTEPYTRMVEYKKFYKYESPTTLVGLEIPSFSNKLYPYPTSKDQALAKKYLEAMPKNVHSLGRSGAYQYDLDIARCMKQVMDLAAAI